MSDSIVARLRASYDEISRRLESDVPQTERDAIKQQIISLFKTVDQAITDLSDLKENIRELVERYKQLAQSEEEGNAPQFTGAVPAARVDHIGASTFIEKGWSLISLGDYPGALQALSQALSLSPADVQAKSLLGWAQMLNEDYDDALGTFQQVLSTEPANSLARINVGYICLKKRIFGEAITAFSSMVRVWLLWANWASKKALAPLRWMPSCPVLESTTAPTLVRPVCSGMLHSQPCR